MEMAQAAGFLCSERDIRDLVRERLLRVLRREGRGRKTIVHHEGDALRLLVMLALKEPPPAGFGVNRFEKLRSWLGAVDEHPLPDEAMPAIAYIMDVGSVPREEAVRAFVEHIRYERPRFDRNLMEQVENTFLPAMSYIFAGFSAYQAPDIYTITDSRTIIEQETVESARSSVVREPFTLRDEIAAFVPPALHGNLDADHLAQFARVIAPQRMESHIRDAPEERLRRAAMAARVLFGPMVTLCPEPFAFSLAYVWAFFVSLLAETPAAELMASQLGQLPESALSQLDGNLGTMAQFVARRKEVSTQRALGGESERMKDEG